MNSMKLWFMRNTVPKREEPGKTGRHPVLKYRVPHGSHPANSFVIGTAVINTHRAHVDLLLGEEGVALRQNEVRGRVDALGVARSEERAD